MLIRLSVLRKMIREELDWIHRSLPKEKAQPQEGKSDESFGAREIEHASDSTLRFFTNASRQMGRKIKEPEV